MHPITEFELPWIKAGYDLFSLHGPGEVKIEKIARIVGISKSSFYHHFADLSIFNERLMEHHLHRAMQLAVQAKQCKAMVPDVLQMLVDAKPDILFNRQLRIHKSNVAYLLCFERAHSMVTEEFIELWADMLGLKNQMSIAKNILNVATDLFYQRLTNDNLTYEWIHSFIEEIKIFLKDVIKSSGVASQIN